jgi:hypothetical protein
LEVLLDACDGQADAFTLVSRVCLKAARP